MKYRDGHSPEGWDFNTETAAGKRFLELKQERTDLGTDFYGLNNEEVGFYFIKQGLMTLQQFYDVFEHYPDMTP